MGEVHVHGFATRLKRDVIVVDVRDALLGIHHYRPGYSVQRQISMRTARSIRSSGAAPLWILMEPGHWSALALQASSEREHDPVEAAAKRARTVPAGKAGKNVGSKRNRKRG